MQLPEGSTIYGDSAYTDYGIEDALKEQDDITLTQVATYKANQKLTYLSVLAMR